MPRHGANDRLGERAVLAGYSDQRCRLGIRDHVEKADFGGVGERPARHGRPLLHKWGLGGLNLRHAVHQQPVAVDGKEAAARLGLARAPLDHRPEEQGADATSSRSGPEKGYSLLGEGDTRDILGCQQGTGGDGGRALDVVVERAQAVAIALEQAPGICSREILPLQQDVGPTLGHGGHERLDESVVFAAAHALVPPADIERVLQALLVVRPYIEEDRQRLGRMDAGAGGVERQLADGNAHATGALVAETQDALAIADDDHAHPIEVRVGEDLAHAVLVGVAQEQSARLAPDLAEALTAFSDRGRVNERQQLLDVAHDQRVEQGLIDVLQIAQEGVALEIRLQAAQRLQSARYLDIQCADVRRQQAMQVKEVALGLGEGRPLVEQRPVDQIEADQVGFDRLVLFARRRCHASSPLGELRRAIAWAA